MNKRVRFTVKLVKPIEGLEGERKYYGENTHLIFCGTSFEGCLMNHIGELEDIEDEINCPMSAIINGLQHGIFVIDKDTKNINDIKYLSSDFSNNIFSDKLIAKSTAFYSITNYNDKAGLVPDKQYDFKDYGKTWFTDIDSAKWYIERHLKD